MVIDSIQQLLRRGKGYIFPGDAERDPGFRSEVERLSVRALWVIGLTNLVMPVLGLVFHSIVQVIEQVPAPGMWSVAVFPFMGLAAIAVARTEFGRRRARLLALLWGFLSGAVLTWAEFYPMVGQAETAHQATALNIIVVLLVGVVAVPALPWQIFLLAISLNTTNYALSSLAESWGLIPPISLHHYAGLDLIALLCTGLAALNYHRLHETYLAHRNEVEAQSRLLVSENAASLGKFAATISHQLNSPLGALESSIDSLERVSERLGGSDDRRLRGMAVDLFKNARGSARQIDDAVRRMQRFTNLDRAEAHPVNLTQLLQDVASMVAPEQNGEVRIDLDCEALPTLTLRPQQMSAVFAKLLQSAVRVSRPNSTVGIRARCDNGEVEVSIVDRGPGLDAKTVQTLFEPTFQVRDGKVVGGHWGLFAAREVVREHGGEIVVRSELGEGSEVIVRLPRNGVQALA